MARGDAGAGVSAAVFSVAFAGVCLAIHRSLPPPEIPEVQEKLEYLSAHADDYDTLFIGSSHVFRQIDPKIFDETAAERGLQTRSFNAGIDGMQPPEDAYFLDEILKYRPKRLQRVFIEINQIRASVDQAKRGTERAVYWHDWERLEEEFREALDDVKESRHLRGKIKALWGPMGDFSEHIPLFIQNMSNLGRGAGLVDRTVRPEQPRVLWTGLGARFNGYLGIEGATMTEADRADYAAEIALRRTRPPNTVPGSATNREAVRRMAEKLEVIGVTPIFIVPPSIPSQNFRPSAEAKSAPAVFDFTGIEQYPALYEESVRLNASHLNAAGAETFSRALAERFSTWELERRRR
jgi:hypothetical protein